MSLKELIQRPQRDKTTTERQKGWQKYAKQLQMRKWLHKGTKQLRDPELIETKLLKRHTTTRRCKWKQNDKKNNFKETHEYKDKQKHKKQITERHDNKKHRITLNTPRRH